MFVIEAREELGTVSGLLVRTRRELTVAELPAATIDRDSAVPYYFQLKRLLLDEMDAGRWAPGDQVPSEPSICDHFGVSRTTVRQALAELEREGRIRREKGRGTFVAEPRSTWLLQSTAGFFEEATRLGHTVRSQVLDRDVRPLPDWAASALDSEAGQDGLRLERVRSIDGQVVMHVVNFLPIEYADAVQEADLETSSLYATLRKAYGLNVSGGRRVIDAVPADEQVAELLGIELGQPVLSVEASSWDDRMRPFECYRASHVSERARIEVHVLSQDAADRAGIDPTKLRTSP